MKVVFISGYNTSSSHVMIKEQIQSCSIPYGLVVRIPAFHAGGPGSIPGVGANYFDTKYLISIEASEGYFLMFLELEGEELRPDKAMGTICFNLKFMTKGLPNANMHLEPENDK